ncbi:MAG: carbonic anhydrase [Maribacter sp.]|jgi:carbonic anhydrase
MDNNGITFGFRIDFCRTLKLPVMREKIMTAVGLLLFSKAINSQQSKEGSIEIEKSKILIESILSAEEQEALTPLDVFNSLAVGNERFVNNDSTARDHSM